MQTAKLNLAEEALRKAIEQNYDYLDAHLNLGVLLSKSNRPKEGLKHLDHVIAKDKEVSEAHYFRADCLTKLAKNEDAIFSYKRALLINPLYFEAHFNMGLLLKVEGYYYDAVVSLREAFRLQPDDLNVARYLGVTLQEMGDHAEGLRIQGRACGYLEFYPTGQKFYKLTGLQSGNLEFPTEKGATVDFIL